AEPTTVLQMPNDTRHFERPRFHPRRNIAQTPDRRGARRDITGLLRHVLFANRVGSLQPDAEIEALRIAWKPNESAGGEALLDLIEVTENQRIDVRLIHVANHRAREGASRSLLYDHVGDHRHVFVLGEALCARRGWARETDRPGRCKDCALL